MNFTLITLSNFFFFCNFSAFFLLPVFIKNLGGEESQIGYVMGSFGITSLLCIPFVSTFADRGGRKIFMAAGAFMMAAASLCFIFVKDFGYAVFALRLIQGAGFASFFTSAATMVSDMAEKDRVAERLGVFGAFTIFSYAAGASAGEWIMKIWGSDGLFIYASCFGFASLAFSLPVRERVPARKRGEDRFGEFFGLFVSRQYGFVLFTNLTLACGLGSLLNFFAVFASERGFAASRFFLTYAATVIAVRLFTSKIADKAGRKRIASPALLIVAVSLLLLSQTGSEAQAVLFCFLFSAGYGILYPALGAMITDRAETGTAKAMGAFNSSFSIGINYAAFPLGIAAESMGLGAMYAAAGLVVFSGFVVFQIFERETPRRGAGQ